jgi:hypothetical protein
MVTFWFCGRDHGTMQKIVADAELADAKPAVDAEGRTWQRRDHWKESCPGVPAPHRKTGSSCRLRLHPS